MSDELQHKYTYGNTFRENNLEHSYMMLTSELRPAGADQEGDPGLVVYCPINGLMRQQSK